MPFYEIYRIRLIFKTFSILVIYKTKYYFPVIFFKKFKNIINLPDCFFIKFPVLEITYADSGKNYSLILFQAPFQLFKIVILFMIGRNGNILSQPLDGLYSVQRSDSPYFSSFLLFMFLLSFHTSLFFVLTHYHSNET